MSVVRIPHILLPRADVDFAKWSVVACDQFTSDKGYWRTLEDYVGDAPSALKLIFPEAKLGENAEGRIRDIDAAMRAYCDDGLFTSVDNMVFVQRETADGLRSGIVLSIDLEEYEYSERSDALVRATEKTVVERLPARIEIRRDALLELPHIMLLADDPDDSIMNFVRERRALLKPLYDFDLNMGGGHISGFEIPFSQELASMMETAADTRRFVRRYGCERGILFAVGDGNHSLAAAKECWENVKSDLSEAEKSIHPARFALCEVVNLYDESLIFQPIHRALFGAESDFTEFMRVRMSGKSTMKVYLDGKYYDIPCSDAPADAVADAQAVIDEYLRAHVDATLDYIHGEAETLKAVEERGGAALFMPTPSKESLFASVLRKGSLPRKTFSMGHARDKRYYLEAKFIK